MTSWLIITQVFEKMVLAQAKARDFTPKLIVVKHPIGGLKDAELVERMDDATAQLLQAIARA